MDEASAPKQLPLLERFKYGIFVIVAAAIVGGVAVLLWRRPEPTSITVIPPDPTPIPSQTPIPSATPTPTPYIIDVKGAVATPGVVTLPYGSRAMHAIEAAGGPRDDANLDAVNLAQILEDGDAVRVPTRQPDAESDLTEKETVYLVTPTPGMYQIYVVGEVIEPGVVNVSAGSRVQDAIEQAGGMTDDADEKGVRLTQLLNDGDYIYVPPLEKEDDFQTPTPNRPPLVHVNYATLGELQTLPGIGESKAQDIIDYRTEHGPFTSLEDLDNVPGIGPGILDDIRDQVVFD